MPQSESNSPQGDLRERYKKAFELARAGNQSEAKVIFETILENKPSLDWSQFNNENSELISFYQYQVKSPTETIRVCRRLIEVQPEQHIAVIAGYKLGAVLEGLNRTSEAIEAYRAVVALHLGRFGKKISQNAYALEATQRLGLLLGFNAEGAAEFQRLVDEAPGDVVNHSKEISMVNLIRNFTDYDSKPLGLYVPTIWRQSEPERDLETFEKILSEYPSCRLAAYMRFRRAEFFHIRFLRGKAVSDFDEALKGYRWVAESPQAALFPDSRSGYPNNIIGHSAGSSMKAIANYRVAQLQEGANPEGADAAYRGIISRYPDVVDIQGNPLGISARVAVLTLWLVKYKTRNPPTDLESLAKELLLGDPGRKFNSLPVGHLALKFLTSIYDRSSRFDSAEKTVRRLALEYPAGVDYVDAELLRNHARAVAAAAGYPGALTECRRLAQDLPPGGGRIAAQFVCAELALESGFKFREASSQFRGIAAAHPQMQGHFNICGCTPSNLVIQSVRRADALDQFDAYVGDPPRLDWVANLKQDYLRSPGFSEQMSLRPEWVLSHLRELLMLENVPVHALLDKIGEPAIPRCAALYAGTEGGGRRTITEALVALSKRYPEVVSQEILKAFGKASQSHSS